VESMDSCQIAHMRRRATIQAEPTPERLKKAGEDLEIGQAYNRAEMRVRDTPIERALLRHIITQHQYDAGIKYYNHWYRAGMAGTIGSSDLTRVFGDGFRNLDPSEARMFHRQRYIQAVLVMGKVGTGIVDRSLSTGDTLESIGYSLGWKNASQARAGATERLRMALDALCRLWGI
jgi:hypothetical protein